jgi:hypothetical protein
MSETIFFVTTEDIETVKESDDWEHVKLHKEPPHGYRCRQVHIRFKPVPQTIISVGGSTYKLVPENEYKK